MAALDSDIAETQVKDGVDRETVETVPGDEAGKYKVYGWETEIEMDLAPKGVTRIFVVCLGIRTVSRNG